jgi:hypothetical protein
MPDNNLQPLFDYMDEMKAELKADIGRLDKKVDHLQATVDSLAKLVKDFRDEHIVMHRRLELLEKWAKQVSEKVGIPLPE